MNKVDFIQKLDLDLEEVLGKGHMGEVRRALDRRNNRELAVKYCTSRQDHKKLEKEAERVSNLTHDNIIRLFGIVVDGNECTGVAFEYMPGGDLSNAMMKLKNGKKRLPWALKCRLMSEICNALSYMHSMKYVHKDVKACNVLLSQELHGKLADFELSRRKTTAFVPDACATLSHMPPEYFGSQDRIPEYEPKFDMYSFGITMFEIMAQVDQVYDNDVSINDAVLQNHVQGGRRPDISKIPNESGMVETDRQKLIMHMRRCWAQEPNERPESIEVKKILNEVYAPLESQAREDATECAKYIIKPRETQVFADGGVRRKDGDVSVENAGSVSIGSANVVNIVHNNVSMNSPTDAPQQRVWVKLTDEEAAEKLDLRRNGIHLNKENENVAEEHLRDVAKYLGVEDSKFLARCLLIKDGEMEYIIEDNRHHGWEEINYKMLKKWKDKSNTPSYKWLATACLSLSRRDLIDRLMAPC